MPVDTKHPEYTEHASDWTLLDDIQKGEKAVKEAGTTYLPILGGQTDDEYQAYKIRGSFFNAFARTLQGLVGLVFRKPIDYNLPKTVENLLPTIMSTGQSFPELCRAVANSTLKYGRVGLLVDSDKDSDPYIAIYGPDSITNWQTVFIGGEEVLTLLVLREMVVSQGKDEFDTIMVEQYRSFSLKENKVEVQVWQKTKESGKTEDKWTVVDTLFPEIRGKRQEKIMFYFIGAEGNTAKVNKPPLMDMAYVNIDHWRLSVDYHHGLHFCSLPTPWAAGFDEDADLTIGPVKVWKSEDPQAQCGYLEFTGQGLTAVKEAMDKDEEIMAILGARIIEQTRSRVETAEAARIRQSGESSAISSIVINISSGLTACFEGLSTWIGSDIPDIYIKLNTDFIDTKIAPQELTALLQTYQAGGISLETFLWNMEKGEVLPPDQSIEDEKLMIEAEGNKGFDDDNTDGDIDDEDDDIDEDDPEE